MSLTKVSYSMISGAPVNVKDFGAVGDGVADDTAAIQAAINYAKTLIVNLQYTGSFIFVNGGPVVVFPAGAYRVSSTIDLNLIKYVNLSGSGKSLIVGAANTTKTVTAFAATDLRYLKVSGLQFQNFDTTFDISTGNLDFSMWSFEDCQAGAVNLFVDSGSYAASRSTLVDFTRFLCQYDVVQIIRSFCDLLTFNDCWLGHASLSPLIYANSLVTIKGGTFVPPGADCTGKCFVYLTNDNGAGGVVDQFETERGVHISNVRSSNEGGNAPLVVCDFPLVNDYRQNPVITVSNCTMACYHPTQYELGGTETGVVHLKQYPAYVAFNNCGPNAIGAPTAKLVSAQSTLPADAPKTFGVYVDDQTLKSAEWAVGELNTFTIAGALRQYINNPEPSIFRGLLENGFLPVTAATTSGVFKSTFTVNTGYVEADYITPITFMLVLMGQSRNTLPDLGYGGTSTYIVTVNGLYDTSLKSSVSATKLHGPGFGIYSADNANIVSLHFGSGETGATTAAMAATQTITVTFGTNLGFGKARIINLVPKSQRYGTYPH